MFLFQTSSTVTAPQISQKDVADLINAQKSLMIGSPSGKVSVKDIITSIGDVYNIGMNIKKSSDVTPAQKKEFFSFVDAWKPWADQALNANASAFKEGDKTGYTGLLKDIADSYTKSDLDLSRRLFYSNFASVLSMYEDYSGGNKLTQKQADMFASFLTKMADKPVVNYYQCRLLVEGMMEVVSGKSPDNWLFNFSTSQDAKDFAAILGALPGFSAQVQQTGASLTFSLRQTSAIEGDFVLPDIAQRTQKKGTAPLANKDGVMQKASSMSITSGAASTSEIYLASKEDAAKSEISDNPTSYLTRSVTIAGSAALLYGESYETDERDSYTFSSLKAKEMIYSLAQRFGFTISEPFEAWIVSNAAGGGQKFLAMLNEAKITLDVVGSADMAVFFDGKNKAEWAAAAGKNLSLAEKRSGLVIKYLTNLNNTVLANSKNKLAFSNTPKGKLHVFQDFTAEQAKQLNLPKYGYTEGDGAKNMSAILNYLKASYAVDEATGKPSEFIHVGQNTFKFTDKERKDAKAFYEALAKIVNENGTLKQGAVDSLNTYFRRMPGDPSLKGAGVKGGGMIYEGKAGVQDKEANVFARAIMESTEVSSRSISLSSEVESELSVSVKAGGAPIVDYHINGVKVDFNDQNGTVEAGTVKTPAGLDRTMAVAFTKDGSINSGYAWETAKAEETEKVEYSPTVKAYNTTVTRGATKNMKLSGMLEKTYPGGRKEEGTVDVRVAFGLRLSSSDQVKLFFTPSPDAKVRKELVYPLEVRGEKQEIVIDRGLVVGDKTYSKDELLSLARKGAVGIKSSGRGGWLTLDGQALITLPDIERQSLNESPDGLLYATSAKYSEKNVLSVAKPDVPNIAFNNTEEVTLDDGRTITEVPSNRRSSQIPLAIPLPESGTVKFGKESYTAKDLKKLAEQNIIAIIADKEEAGSTIRTVYRIDGSELCPLKNFMTGFLPRVDDLFVTKQGVKGDFTIKTYIPDVSGFRIGGQVAAKGKTLKAGQYDTSNTSEVVLLIYPEQKAGTIDVPNAKGE